jgi:hypothetical protein
MLSILKTLFDGRRVGRARPSSRPALEVLEQRDVPSTAGYSAWGGADFFIERGVLMERSYSGQVYTLLAGVNSVSVHPDYGWLSSTRRSNVSADVIDSLGNLWQWNDGAWRYIASGVQQVSAGWNGDSAVLFNNGNLDRFNARTGALSFVHSGVVSTSIGQSVHDTAMIDFITTNGNAYEWLGNQSGSGGQLEALCGSAKQVSAGTNGVSAVLISNGDVWVHADGPYYNNIYNYPGHWQYLTGGVASISCGEDADQRPTIDVVLTNGQAYENDNGQSWAYIGSSVTEVDAGDAGATEVVSTPGTLFGLWGALGYRDITRFVNNVTQVPQDQWLTVQAY